VPNPLPLIPFLCVLCVSNEHSEWAVNIFLICVIHEICVQKEFYSFLSNQVLDRTQKPWKRKAKNPASPFRQVTLSQFLSGN